MSLCQAIWPNQSCPSCLYDQVQAGNKEMGPDIIRVTYCSLGGLSLMVVLQNYESEASHWKESSECAVLTESFEQKILEMEGLEVKACISKGLGSSTGGEHVEPH